MGGFSAGYSHQWKQSFATTYYDLDCLAFKTTNAGYAVLSACTGNSNTWQFSGASGTSNAFMAWVGTQNGSIFDLELDTYDQPLDTLPNGGLLALTLFKRENRLYAPDNDNDNIGAAITVQMFTIQVNLITTVIPLATHAMRMMMQIPSAMSSIFAQEVTRAGFQRASPIMTVTVAGTYQVKMLTMIMTDIQT